MQSDLILLNPRRIAALATSLAALTIIIGLSAASARNDDNSRTFFLSEARSLLDWGGAPASVAQSSGSTPLDVAHQRTAAGSRAQRLAKLRADARLKMAAVRGAKPVTILTDATLQRGDAVMTGRGIRVFTGSAAFPHREKDFVGVTGAGGLPRAVARTLIALNNVPPA